MSAPMEKRFYRRWYDQGPHINQAVTELLRLSMEYQQVFSHLILSVSDALQEAHRKQGQLKSLGADRATGLIKAQEKRRAEDKNPQLGKAFRRIFVLSDTHRKFLMARVSMSVWSLKEYQATCQRHDREENIKEAIGLIHAGFEKGLAGPKAYIDKLNLLDEESTLAFQKLAAQFDESLEVPVSPTHAESKPADPKPKEYQTKRDRLKENEGGMRIRHLNET